MSKMWFTIRSILNVYERFDVIQKSLDGFISIDYEIKDNMVRESSIECRREDRRIKSERSCSTR